MRGAPGIAKLITITSRTDRAFALAGDAAEGTIPHRGWRAAKNTGRDAIHEGNPPAAIGRGAMSRKNPSVARHARDCRICRHADRQAIEADFIAWRSPSEIAKAYHIQRSTLYLHAAALGLMTEREKNVKAALSRFIERCANVKASAASFVAACVALSKLNEQGQTIDRVSLSSSLRQAYLTFENWTIGELEDFAVRGTIPARLSATRIAPKELP